MPDVRAARAEEVRHHLAQARGLARVELARAQALARAARAAAAQAAVVATETPARAAAERAARLAEVEGRHADTLADLTDRAAEAAEKEAPAAAGAAWESWHMSTRDRSATPKLLRIGEVRVGEHPPVPALVPLLDRAHVALTGEPAAQVDQVLTTLLLRALGATPPGSVRLTGYDPERLGGGLAGFAPLAAGGLLRFVGPGGLGALLDTLVEEIRRINETVLAGDYPSLGALAAANDGRRPEPWRVAVLLGDGGDLSRHERAQLDRIVRTGVACGVHLVSRGIPLAEDPKVETVTVAGRRAAVTGCGSLPVSLDPPPPAERVGEVCRIIADMVAAGPAPAVFADLIPEKLWTESSATALVAPVGEGVDGRPVEVVLGDHPPHALIGGPSGSGKTNFIYAWLGALTARYSPAELELYLLDFKEGVSFARFAPGHRDPTWLPHVRLVGINVNTDREFGLGLLRFLGTELRRRAEAAKRAEATKLAELRAEDPNGHWPRIVAVVDEFQVLLAGRDALATEAVTLLEDLARRGRSQGIHLVLASQDVSGIEALWGRSALVAQFSLRIALPKARRILAETNTAAEEIPRYHAVVNAESGSPVANRIVRMPESSSRPRRARHPHGRGVRGARGGGALAGRAGRALFRGVPGRRRRGGGTTAAAVDISQPVVRPRKRPGPAGRDRGRPGRGERAALPRAVRAGRRRRPARRQADRRLRSRAPAPDPPQWTAAPHARAGLVAWGRAAARRPRRRGRPLRRDRCLGGARRPRPRAGAAVAPAGWADVVPPAVARAVLRPGGAPYRRRDHPLWTVR